ncbi:glycoside hydrolase family 1 protein [Oenococcus alcoholitolerans]|uniref:glycoside hydrolase family 1 protein n=1 Tax=Oenococcus alcoholitolerans TaxID=931074 RepID=UPI003F7017DB
MTTLDKNFFWGNSTSSMQTEGAWNLDGKGMSVYDIRPAADNSSDWKTAIDDYHRFQEDIDLMKDMGMNFYRFQISWSRVQPDGEGNFNQKGIDFYHNFIDALLKAGIEPMICLYHFDMPLNLARKYNGFVNRELVFKFLDYGKKMVDEFGDKVKYWITFNEQNCYSLSWAFKNSGYITGQKSLSDLYLIQHNVMLAHSLFTQYLHKEKPKDLVGGMLAYQEVYPAVSTPENVEAVRVFKEFSNNNLINLFTRGKYSQEVLSYMKANNLSDILKNKDLETISKTKNDFLSFSYYSSSLLDSSLIPVNAVPNYYIDLGHKVNPYLRTNEWGWQIDSLAFKGILLYLSDLTGQPIFPIENGIGAREKWDGKHQIDDQYRIDYHRAHIQALKEAVEQGAKVIGYLGWGLIDIPSSQGNVDKRYGAVYVNRTNHQLLDLKRVPKKSYFWFKKVFASNGEEL